MTRVNPTVVHNGTDLSPLQVERTARSLCFTLKDGSVSGPIWLREGVRTSNVVWLTTRQGRILSSSDALVKIADHVVTSLDLLSVILQEDTDGFESARNIARHYDMEIVGAIPALNVFQFRLRARSVGERNALLNRLAIDAAVVGVVVEDDNLQAPEDPERVIDPPDREGWVANNFHQAVEIYARYLGEPGREKLLSRVMVGVIEQGVDFDAVDFAEFARPCGGVAVCLYARHSPAANGMVRLSRASWPPAFIQMGIWPF
ncbi:hypothetical protein ACIPZF_02775 [Pseudomonas sp. NPDC089752]|uniref:hypothetical protein n=1 Tax=Pseudomonas sp. NPDC089752 TaxID=3364472 RepID=UPI00382DC956